MPGGASQPHGPSVGKSMTDSYEFSAVSPRIKSWCPVETAARLRSKHVVREPVLLRHRPVRLDLIWIHVFIRASWASFVADVDGAPAVHLPAVVFGGEREMAIIEVKLGVEIAFFELCPAAVFVLTAANSVRTREMREQIIEAVIFLDDYNDVFYVVSK